MKKTYKNQRVLKSYPQENEKNDIFMLDIPLFLNEKIELSTELSTGTKKEGGIVKKFHYPLVKFFHPNKIKLFLIKRKGIKKRGFFSKVIHRLKILLFSRKKGGEFMTIDELQQINDLLNAFLSECSTLSREKGDCIEKNKFINGYEVFLICKRRI